MDYEHLRGNLVINNILVLLLMFAQGDSDSYLLTLPQNDALKKLEHLAISEDLIEINEALLCTAGGFGDVYKATLRGRDNLPSRLVAVKELRGVGDDVTRIRLAIHLTRELQVWTRLRHPNVLELIGYHLNPQMTTARFISPFMTNGNIDEYLENTPRPVPDNLRLKLLRGSLNGLVYLHSLNPPICHADIKPGNVLITDEIEAVLCDFGLARLADGQSSGLTTTKTIKGSTRYMSPELLEEDPVHTLSSDVWAYGCLVLKVMTGTLPYNSARSENQTLLALARKQSPVELDNLNLQDEKLRMLLMKCWDMDPSARPSSYECQLYLPQSEIREPVLAETRPKSFASADVDYSDHHERSASSSDDDISVTAPKGDSLSQSDPQQATVKPVQPKMSLSDVLLASLSPSTLYHAEKTLSTLSTTRPQFLTSLLELVLDQSQQIQARQAAAVYFKNIIKRRWDSEVNEEIPIDQNEKNVLKEQLVPAMVTLSSQRKLLRTQIADAVGLIAAVDFPRLWPGLLPQLVSYLTPVDYTVNVCILEIAHSIFARWRAQTRSDELYRAINYTLENFQDPFFAVFDATATALLSGQPIPNLSAVAQAQSLLMQIYLDLTFQDIPPEFEDSIAHFFGTDDGDEGYFIRFLGWDPLA
ncbi:importin-alpha export receptor [Tulasnella sp. UAMH 9824]|nr:importin-alpha export receptor [Tulasnella sp. UAMH 9824]